MCRHSACMAGRGDSGVEPCLPSPTTPSCCLSCSPRLTATNILLSPLLSHYRNDDTRFRQGCECVWLYAGSGDLSLSLHTSAFLYWAIFHALNFNLDNIIKVYLKYNSPHWKFPHLLTCANPCCIITQSSPQAVFECFCHSIKKTDWQSWAIPF